jgi:hypothetical protein
MQHRTLTSSYALGWGEVTVDWTPDPLLYRVARMKNLAHIWIDRKMVLPLSLSPISEPKGKRGLLARPRTV